MTREDIEKRYKTGEGNYIDPDPDAYSFHFMVREIRFLLTRIRELEEGIREILDSTSSQYRKPASLLLQDVIGKLQKLLEDR